MSTDARNGPSEGPAKAESATGSVSDILSAARTGHGPVQASKAELVVDARWNDGERSCPAEGSQEAEDEQSGKVRRERDAPAERREAQIGDEEY